MENLRRDSLILVLVCIGVSILWGAAIGYSGAAWIDFRAVYAGTRCLIHEHNPYNVGDLEREFLSEDGRRPLDTPTHLQAITLYVNLPTSFIVVAPFAVLSWGPAHVLWILLTGGVLTLALLLMWSAGATYAPQVSTLLACFLAINCECMFAGGNTAGMVVGLCGIAVWCFLQNRFVRIGVACLALSLAIKPHDAGPIWLFFVLAGGAYRKRALQSFVITAAIGLTAALWVSHVAPTWTHDWSRNLAAISAPGGINDPGPNAVKDGSLFSIVDLQAALSIFRDDPRFYNLASYLICGGFLLVWLIRTSRTRFSVPTAWFALAAATTFGLLITYHRVWDAKLVMLAIPPCCLLWAEGSARGKAAVVVTALAAFFTGDISLTLFEMVFGSLHIGLNGILRQALALVLIRPASLALLAMGVFYLWIYVRPIRRSQVAAAVSQDLERVST